MMTVVSQQMQKGGLCMSRMFLKHFFTDIKGSQLKC